MAFFEFAQGLASQIMRADISQDEQRLTYAFRRSLSRLPSEQELTRLLKFFEAQREYFKSTPADAAQVVEDHGRVGMARAHSVQVRQIAL